MKKLLVGAVIASASLIYCNENNLPTGPSTGDTTPSISPAPSQDQNPPVAAPGAGEQAPNQARGELRIEGTYGTCEQATSYHRNYLSVFKVSDSGGQNRVSLHKSGEGELACGTLIQVDCTVRDPSPQAGNISA